MPSKKYKFLIKKSDQAEFTGIDDGETKTINLRQKIKKKGYFGKIDGASEPATDRSPDTMYQVL
jgi:hypothetical protein